MSASYVVRLARASDLPQVGPVEESGTALFEAELGDLTGTALTGSPPSGRDRIDQPGFLLVAAERGSGRVAGFAHVLYLDGSAHLEQISVRADVLRQGLGSRLVRAAMEEARWAGFDRISLCTYRDLPFNGPFYADLGFAEVERLEPFQRRLREHEVALGLDAFGTRVVMGRGLDRQVTRE